MLRNLLFFALLFSVTAISAQSVPQAFRYQAVLRDLDDNIITNQQVGILLSLIQNQDSVVYQEAHTVSTNSIGLMILNIGAGSAVTGNFSAIDWGQTTSLGIALDPAGGDQYEDLGFVDLLSVPYALYAGNAGGSNEDADADPVNELQMLTQNGDTIVLSQGGGSIVIDREDADADPANELQMLSITGDQLSLSQGGGTITLPSADDADADPTNEIEMPGDVQAGDMAYYNGSNWVKVDKGSGGQMLHISNSGVPYWAGGPSTIELNEVSVGGTFVYVHPTVNNTDLPFNPQGTFSNLTGVESITFANFNAALSDFDGEGNTKVLVDLYGEGNYAAKVCYDLEAFGFDDWYLPATGEMEQIYQKFSVGAGDGTYAGPVRFWTSSISSGTGSPSTNTYGFNPSGNINPASNGGRGQVLCVRK